MDRIFHISNHALERMESRNVSKTKVAQTLYCGQIYASSTGAHKAKLLEHCGKTVSEYVVVFSKKENLIITVEHNIKRAEQNTDEFLSKHRLRKIYKQRKRALREEEFNSWCREEYGAHRLAFTA